MPYTDYDVGGSMEDWRQYLPQNQTATPYNNPNGGGTYGYGYSGGSSSNAPVEINRSAPAMRNPYNAQPMPWSFNEQAGMLANNIGQSPFRPPMNPRYNQWAGGGKGQPQPRPQFGGGKIQPQFGGGKGQYMQPRLQSGGGKFA